MWNMRLKKEGSSVENVCEDPIHQTRKNKEIKIDEIDLCHSTLMQ